MTLQIREEARLDLEAAARWYASQAPGLGRQFLSEVRDVFRRIEANPESYPALHPGTRRALVIPVSRAIWATLSLLGVLIHLRTAARVVWS